jgi:hypothetical protein
MTTASNQSTRAALQSKLDLHRAAHGADQESHPHVRLMQDALRTGDAAIQAAVHDYVDRSMPEETAGLAAVAAELDADKRAPVLAYEIDIASTPRANSTTPGELHNLMRRQCAVRGQFAFRRETFTNVAGEPLCARVLVPASHGVDAAALEAAFHVLETHALQTNPMIAKDASAALLAAAIARAAKKVGKCVHDWRA